MKNLSLEYRVRSVVLLVRSSKYSAGLKKDIE